MAATTLSSLEKKMRLAALGYPGAVEEFPWGERVIKVNKKIFLFVNISDGTFCVTLKLPHTGEMALSLSFVEPTGYGLGKAGWVSARFDRADEVPLALLLEWLEESYRAVAPKKLVQALEEQAATRTRKRAR